MNKTYKSSYTHRAIICLLATSMCVVSCSDPEPLDGVYSSADYLNIESGNIALAVSQLEGKIVIKSNCHWRIIKQTDSNSNWLSIGQSDGTGDQTVSITATSSNPSSTQSRTVTLTVQTDAGLVQTVTVTQSPSAESITLSPDILNFDYTGGTQVFVVSSNADWKFETISETWISIDHDTWSESNQQITVSVTVSENESESDTREARLVVKTKSGKTNPVSLRITQAKNATTLSADKEGATINVPATSQSNVITLTGTASWTAKTTEDWVTIHQPSGKGGMEFSFTCADNYTLSERTATITIQSVPNTIVNTIKQAAATLPEVGDINIVRGNETVTLQCSYTSMFPVEEYGFCYSSTEANPTTDDSVIRLTPDTPSTDGTFSSALSDLDAAIDYYGRAYVRSAVGIAYGKSIQFTTSGQIPDGNDNIVPNPTKKR